MLIHGYDFPVKPGRLDWLRQLRTAEDNFGAARAAALKNAVDDVEALGLLAAATDDYLCTVLGEDYAELAGVDTQDLLDLKSCADDLNAAVQQAAVAMRAAAAPLASAAPSAAPAIGEAARPFAALSRDERRAYVRALRGGGK